MPSMPYLRLFTRASKTETLDDTDERVQYTGAWEVGGQAPEYQSTTHFTRTPDAFLKFSFRGTQVRVVGSLGPTEMNHGPASFSYSLDGGERQGVVNTDPISDNKHRYNTQFVLLGSLPNTDHTLTMTHLEGGPWFVDRLEVVLDLPDPEPLTTGREESETPIPTVTSAPQSSKTSNTQDRPVSTSTETSSFNTKTTSVKVTELTQVSIPLPTTPGTGTASYGSSTTATVVGPDRTSDTAISPGQPAAQPNGLAIALGVVGAVLLLTVLGLVRFLWVKKKRGTRQHHSQSDGVNPFRPTVTEPSQPILAPMKGMPVLEDDSTMPESEWTSGASVTADSSSSADLSPPPYSRNT